MGACQFDTQRLGKTVAEAFTAAVDQAAHEYGHGGYTGTIAEKHGYRLVTVPAGFTADKFIDALLEAANHSHYGDSPLPKRTDASYAWRTRAAKAHAKLLAVLGARELARLLELLNDKWGDCLAVEVTGKALTAAKAEHDSRRGYSYETDRNGRMIEGTKKFGSPSARGMHLYRFVGTASS